MRTLPSYMVIRAPCSNGPPQLPKLGALSESRARVTSPLPAYARAVPLVPPLKRLLDRVTSEVSLYCLVLMLPCPTMTVLDEPSGMVLTLYLDGPPSGLLGSLLM